MKLEPGKLYRTRDGRKAGPMATYPNSKLLIGNVEPGDSGDLGRLFCIEDGKHFLNERRLDLVAEWDGPVRMVITKQIVPGDYGAVHVGVVGIGVGWVHLGVRAGEYHTDDLRNIIATLTEIADAMEGK